jgi:isopenicillin N synthase-like dioxygenase
MGSIPESESNGTNTTIIPIIDLSPFTSSPSSSSSSSSSSPPSHTSSAARLKAAQDLVRACRDVGFVYVKNHGVPQDELDKAFALSKQFYDLPTGEKMKAPHPPGWAVHRGYSWPGLEKVSGALSEKNDEEWVSKLREVQDYKVRPSGSLHALRLVLALRARGALPPDHPLY